MSESNTAKPAETPTEVAVEPAVTEAAAVVETAAPIVATEAAAEVAAEPVVTEAAAEAKPDGVTPHTDTPTLLEGAGKEPAATEAKPTETAAASPAGTEAVPPVYEFKMPEGVALDPERIAGYTDVLSQHHVPPEAGQALLDMHTAEMQRYDQHLRSEQHRVFAETRRSWVDQIKADEQLGGAGFDTAMKAVARMRDLLVPEAHREAFGDFLRVTGAGDHPEFIRALHNAARLFDEPTPPAVPARPTDAGAPKGRGYRRVMYDHPSSVRAAG